LATSNQRRVSSYDTDIFGSELDAALDMIRYTFFRNRQSCVGPTDTVDFIFHCLLSTTHTFIFHIQQVFGGAFLAGLRTTFTYQSLIGCENQRQYISFVTYIRNGADFSRSSVLHRTQNRGIHLTDTHTLTLRYEIISDIPLEDVRKRL
jgi:hypothetical protein